MYLRTCGSFKSANHKKRLGPQIANTQDVTFAEGPKSNRLVRSANLRICDLWNFFADHPPLDFTNNNNLLRVSVSCS
jgi:hypothetical protein